MQVRVIFSHLPFPVLNNLSTRRCGCIAGFWTAGDDTSRERCVAKADATRIVNADIFKLAGASALQSLASLGEGQLETIIRERGLSEEQVTQMQAIGSLPPGMLNALVTSGGNFGLMNMAKTGAAGGTGGGFQPATSAGRRLLSEGMAKFDALQTEGRMPPPPPRSQSVPPQRPNSTPLPVPFTGKPRGRAAAREGSQHNPTKGKMLARQALGQQDPRPASAPPQSSSFIRTHAPSPRQSRVDVGADASPSVSSLDETWGAVFNKSEVSFRPRMES